MFWSVNDYLNAWRGVLRMTITAAALSPATLSVSCLDNPAAKAEKGESREAARPVRVVEAATAVLPRVVSVTGTLAAMEQAPLGMKVAGRLGSIDVDLGSRVESGQPLARLVPVDFELRVQQAEAAVEQARARLGLAGDDPNERIDPELSALVRQARAVLHEAELARNRARRLFEEKLISQSDLDAAETAFVVADGRYQDAYEEVLNRRAVLSQRRSELELARQQLKDTVLRAPFAGAVREKHASPGEYLTAGQQVVTLVRVDPLRLKVAVPEREGADVRIGQAVRLTVEGDQRTYEGRIARVSPAIEEGSRTLMVEADVPNRDGVLRPGAFASAEIVTTSGGRSVLVPVTAIVTFAGIEKVILVRDGKSVEKRVRTGRRSGDQIEILEGLAVGDPVVVEPGNLVGGQAVAPLG